MARRYGVFPLRLRAFVHDTILPYGRRLNIAAGVYISSRRCQDAHWDISTNTGDDSDRVTSSINVINAKRCQQCHNYIPVRINKMGKYCHRCGHGSMWPAVGLPRTHESLCVRCLSKGLVKHIGPITISRFPKYNLFHSFKAFREKYVFLYPTRIFCSFPAVYIREQTILPPMAELATEHSMEQMKTNAS